MIEFLVGCEFSEAVAVAAEDFSTNCGLLSPLNRALAEHRVRARGWGTALLWLSQVDHVEEFLVVGDGEWD